MNEISHYKEIFTALMIIAFIIMICIHSHIYYSTKNSLTIASVPTPQIENKTILYWTKFFDNKNMYFGTGSEMFRHCPVNNCFATWDRSLRPIEQFDAIIFHAPEYSTLRDGYPIKRSLHQKYIFYSMETAVNTRIDERTNRHFYNWTMSFRRDADIHRPYDFIREIERYYVMPTVDEIRGRRKKVAWFVSNCYSRGSQQRLEYARELQKFIQVDIYGACGNLSCPRFWGAKCYQMLERDYKFYLSFENSMCRDYVTEKLYNALKLNIVPIMLGFFNNTSVAPPNSVINTQDFPSPKYLADYLWELDRNPERYLEYFEWKKHYRVERAEPYTVCQWCELLNKPITYSSYSDVKGWYYGDENNCLIWPRKTEN